MSFDKLLSPAIPGANTDKDTAQGLLSFCPEKGGNSDDYAWKMEPWQSVFVTTMQVLGILIQLVLLVGLCFNCYRYVYKLKHKPFTILVFYFAAAITLISLVTAFSVIQNPDNQQVIVEFSSLFVAEWGIQIIGVSQAAQSLELVVLINSIKVAEMQEQNGAKFRRHKMIINVCLAVITAIILIPPIQYIIRSTIIYNKDCRKFE